MSNPIALLRDDFENNVIDLAWSLTSWTGSATFAETVGQARLTLPSSTAGSHSAFYRTSATYDLTGDSFYWNIQTMVATGVAATATFQLLGALDGTSQVYWRQVSNTITARYLTVAGGDVQLFTATWSSSTYKYLRIRESGGTTFWDSSTNGTSWTNRASVANPFSMTALYVQFAASCGNVAAPGSLRLDDVNLILPAPSSTWRETTADWSIENRFRPVTLASDGGKQGVLVTADTMDETTRALGGTIHYYAGPLGSVSGGYLALTEYASLALAQASAFPIPVSGRVDLPALIDARYMRLYHRSIDASAHTIYEFVPRRIVQADDIEAESIQAIHIVAHTITADQIAAHTITAVEIGTVNLDATARITAGGGAVMLDDGGIQIVAGAYAGGYNPLSAIDWVDVLGGVRNGSIYGTFTGGVQTGVFIESLSDSTNAQSGITLSALPATGLGLASAGIVMLSEETSPATKSSIVTSAQAMLIATSGLRIGGTTSAVADGELTTSGNVGLGAAPNSVIRLYAKGAGATSATYGIWIENSASSKLIVARNDGYIQMGASGAAIGVYGAAGTTKPTVTGSRGGNAALASFLTGMANIGWIVDSSTV